MRLAGDEETIDWLIKMRRLPADLMLDQAIANRTVSAADARKVGALLARFYMRSLPVEMTTSEYRKRLTDDIRANQRELEKPDYALPADLLGSTTSAQLEFLEQGRELLDRRAQNGKIIEAHGDLRPEHICLEREPVIIDCADEFLSVFDGYSIGSNDLTQLALGLDRDSGTVAHLFDKRNAAVRQMISRAIESAHGAGKPIDICGQAPSDYPDFAAWLVRLGIHSISLNPDTAIKTAFVIAEEEFANHLSSP